jgi:membrane protein YdbS with pleckstrin-like domain
MGKKKNYDRLSFTGALFLLLLALKLTKTIDWSWWWVTAPIWGSTAFVLVGFLMCVVWYTIYPKQKNNDGTEYTPRETKESKFMRRLREKMEENERLKNLN